MSKYDKMLELNKRKSEEKVERAVLTIRTMLPEQIHFRFHRLTDNVSPWIHHTSLLFHCCINLTSYNRILVKESSR